MKISLEEMLSAHPGLVFDPPDNEDGNDIIELGDDQLALDSRLKGINEACCSMESLLVYDDFFMKAETPETEEDEKRRMTEYEIARNSINSIVRRNAIDSKPLPAVGVVTMENYRTLALEGIGDMLKKFWEAIVRTFKKIWDRLTKKSDSEKLTEGAASSNDDAEAIKEALRTHGKSLKAEDGKVLTDIPVTSAFNYLEKDVDIHDLQKLVQELLKSKNTVLNLAISVTESTTSASKVIAGLKGGEQIGNVKAHADRALEHIRSTIETKLARAELGKISDEVKKTIFGEKLDKIDMGKVREIAGLTRDAAAYFYMVNEEGDVSLPDGTYVTERAPHEAKVKVIVPSLEECGQLAETTRKLQEEVLDFKKSYERICDETVKSQQSLLVEIEQMLKKVAGDDKKDHRDLLVVCKTILSQLAKITGAVQKTVTGIYSSTQDIENLRTAFMAEMPPEVKEETNKRKAKRKGKSKPSAAAAAS